MKISSFLKYLFLLQLIGCTENHYNIGYNFHKQTEKIKLSSNKIDIISVLGSPNLSSNLGGDSWYYIEHTLKRKTFFAPIIISQKVLRLDFEHDKLIKIKNFGQNDLQKISFNKDYTLTKGDDENLIKELFSNVKSSNFVPINF